MKITMSEIRKVQKYLIKIRGLYIQQTMKDKNIGFSDAYSKCQKDYIQKYNTEYPRTY